MFHELAFSFDANRCVLGRIFTVKRGKIAFNTGLFNLMNFV